MDRGLFSLIHPVTNEVLAVIYEDRVDFYNERLKQAMQLFGVNIPESDRHAYGNKRTLFPHEKEFPKAFKEVYFPMALREAGMILKKYPSS